MSYLDPPPMPAPVVVMKDVGGLVRAYQDRTELYRAQNREVRLHECRSACTLALSLPNACVYPSSQLKFHQAYNELTKQVDLGVTQELWNAYPQAVRNRLGTLTRAYKVIGGAELIAMGLRNCNAPPQQPKIMLAKARRADPGEGSDFLRGVQNALSSLTAPASPSVKPQLQAALPAQSPGRPIARPPLDARPQGEAPQSPAPQSSTPMPPQRPVKIGALSPLPMPPLAPSTPAYLMPIPGSAPILEARFITLQAALRKLSAAP